MAASTTSKHFLVVAVWCSRNSIRCRKELTLHGARLVLRGVTSGIRYLGT